MILGLAFWWGMTIVSLGMSEHKLSLSNSELDRVKNELKTTKEQIVEAASVVKTASDEREKEVQLLGESITKLEAAIAERIAKDRASVAELVAQHKEKIKGMEDELRFRENQVIKFHQSNEGLRKQNDDLRAENAVLKSRLCGKQ